MKALSTSATSNVKTKPGGKSPKRKDGAVGLETALRQNEHAKELVIAAAGELSSANAVLRQELAEKETPPAVDDAIEKIEDAEDKVVEVTEKLTAVNRTLKVEVRGRILLDHQLAAANEQGDAYRYAAFHDPLTGLPNRALFQDRFQQLLVQAQRHGRNLALLFVDLDAFKVVNDTHGHDAGDRVLQTIAGRLGKCIRSDDTVCRYGGDEFLFLLTEAHERLDLIAIAEKIVNAVKETCEVRVGDEVIHLQASASIGIALYPQHGTNPDTLISNADIAMYRAKRSGSRVEFAR